MSRIGCAIFMTLLSALASRGAQAAMRLVDDTRRIDLISELGIWTDPERKLDASRVAQGRDLPSPRSAQVGYAPGWVWIRFEVMNDVAGDPDGRWVLSFLPYLVNELELFQFDPERLDRPAWTAIYHTGRGGLEGSLHRRSPTFEVRIPRGTRSLFVARLRSHHHITATARISKPEVHAGLELREQVFMGMYFGVMLVLAVYNLMVFLSIRELAYLMYVFYVASMGMTTATLAGFTDLWFESLPLSRFLGTMSMSAALGGLAFTTLFLRLKENAPRLYRAAQAVIAAAVSLALIVLLPTVYDLRFPSVGRWIDIVIVATVTLIFASAVYSAAKRVPYAFSFLAAWLSACVMVGVFFAGRFGLIPSGIFTQFGLHIGTGLEMMLLSLALAARIRDLREGKLVAERKALETDRLRDLIHITCHDLANPLAVIHMHTEGWLLEPDRFLKDPELLKATWNAVAKAAGQQRSILEYVKKKEAVETGKKAIELGPVSLNQVMEDVSFVFRKPLDNKSLHLITHIGHGSEDLRVLADPVVLSHTVMNNLISNAIKFSPEGGRIEVFAERRGDRVEIQVRDQGVGIPRRLLRTIFHPEAVTSRPGTRGETGTGFGMPLVRAMLDHMGGTITIESRSREDGFEQTGTTVHVVLRAIAAGPAKIAA